MLNDSYPAAGKRVRACKVDMLKQVTTKMKCRSGGNSALWLAIQEEKVVRESAAKFAIAKSNGKHNMH